MDWDEGAGFNGESLKLTNGKCVYCPNLGGSAAKQAIYEIKPDNPVNPVVVEWKQKDFCGNESLHYQVWTWPVPEANPMPE